MITLNIKFPLLSFSLFKVVLVIVEKLKVSFKMKRKVLNVVMWIKIDVKYTRESQSRRQGMFTVYDKEKDFGAFDDN